MNELINPGAPGAEAGVSAKERRWANETKFFNQMAERLGPTLSPTSPEVVARYASPRRWYDKEYRFRLLGDLRGKRVLDVGCGEGSNAALLARQGAHVTGVDISPGLIEIARNRTQLDGVADRTEFICAPLEHAMLPEQSFDIIWGDGILHHLIDELEPAMRHIAACAKPGARVVFSEPVNFSPLLRRLRRHVPIHTDATPDERPLEPKEIAIVRRYVPDLELRPFHLLSRFERFVVNLADYEHSPVVQRWLCDALHVADFGLLALPPLRRLGGMSVLSGHIG